MSAAAAFEFTVYGRPQQRGSKRPVRLGGKADGRIILVDSNKKSKDWMTSVAQVAGEYWKHETELITDPVVLKAAFFFARPKSHYGTGRNADRLKDLAPTVHAQSPDLAKLLRALEDALTGVVWKDDKQVCQYGEGTGRYWTVAQERTQVWIEVCTAARLKAAEEAMS